MRLCIRLYVGLTMPLVSMLGFGVKSTGSPLFRPNRMDYGAGTAQSCVFGADVDLDGDTDLFAPAVNYDAGQGPRSVFAADLDSDGDTDLAVANEWSDDVSILLNNGDGTFAAAVNYGAGMGPLSVFGADLDGDGDTDLAVANYRSHDVSVLLNTTNHPGIQEARIRPPLDFARDTQGSGIRLMQNQPNPFRESTIINYYVPTPVHVTLKIYDISGQQVKSLVDVRQAAGNYSVGWDGKTESGKRVPGGVHFCRLKTCNFTATRKMVVLK